MSTEFPFLRDLRAFTQGEAICFAVLAAMRSVSRGMYGYYPFLGDESWSLFQRATDTIHDELVDIRDKYPDHGLWTDDEALWAESVMERIVDMQRVVMGDGCA